MQKLNGELKKRNEIIPSYELAAAEHLDYYLGEYISLIERESVVFGNGQERAEPLLKARERIQLMVKSMKKSIAMIEEWIRLEELMDKKRMI